MILQMEPTQQETACSSSRRGTCRSPELLCDSREALPGGYRVPRLVYSSFSSADDKSRDGTDACQAYVHDGSPLSSVLAVPSAYVTMMTRSVRPAALPLVLPRKLRCLK